MQELKIGLNEAGQRFDKFLRKALPEAGSSLIYKQLRKKNITLNGRKAEGGEILRLGDTVQCFFSQETFLKFRGGGSNIGMRNPGRRNPGTADFSAQGGSRQRLQETVASEFLRAYQNLKGVSVLYEDPHILILNKPAGILTQKARPEDLSLNEWMIGYLLQKGVYTEEALSTFRPSVCNRLDRNTSGLVLCGKTLAGTQALSLLLREHLLGKFYRTICHGMLLKEQMLEGYLVKDPVNNKVTVLVNGGEAAAREETAGKDPAPIRTRYVPLRWTEDYTLLEIELFTGKTHQIRAHLASVGHPLLGDAKYGEKKDNLVTKNVFHLNHHLLHADHVRFPEWESLRARYAALAAYEEVLKPLSGKTIRAPLPDSFQRAERKLWPE